MYNPNIIKYRLEDVKHWPNVIYSKLQVLNENNKLIDVEVKKEEADLLMYLKMLSNKLSEKEMNKIVELVDNYGQIKYDGGYNKCANNLNKL